MTMMSILPQSQALLAFRSRKWDSCVQICDKILQDTPSETIEVLKLQAQSRQKEKVVAQSIHKPQMELLNKRYVLNPKFSKVYLELLLSRSDYSKAIELIKENLAAKKDDGYWKLQYGKCLIHLDQLKDAKNILNESLQISQIVPILETRHLLNSAKLNKLLISDKNIELHKYFLADTCQKYPLDPLSALHRAQFSELLCENEADTIYPLYKQVYQINPLDFIALNKMAELSLLKSPEVSVTIYQRLLHFYRLHRNAQIWNNLGLATFYAQQFNVSWHCFLNAIECIRQQKREKNDRNELLSNIWNNLGNLTCRLGEFQIASRCFSISVSLFQEDGSIFNNLAVLVSLRDFNCREKVITLLDKAVELGNEVAIENMERIELFLTKMRTFLGQKVYSVPILKLYWPFFLSGPTAFFLFSWVHTKFSDDPTDKWNKIVDIVKKGTEVQKMKNEATAYYEKGLLESQKH